MTAYFWDITFEINDDINETVLICINDQLLEPGFTEDTVVASAENSLKVLQPDVSVKTKTIVKRKH
jgi:hypothetical protein